VVQMSVHSPRTLRCPRNKNWRNPPPCLICPNTGSTVSFRMAYSRRPRFVRSGRRYPAAAEPRARSHDDDRKFPHRVSKNIPKGAEVTAHD